MAKEIDVLVCGVGTGGTKMPVEKNPRGDHKKISS